MRLKLRSLTVGHRSAGLVALLALVAPPSTGAQGGGRDSGRRRRRRLGGGGRCRGCRSRARGHHGTSVTDQRGQFRLVGTEPGTGVLRVRSLGFGARTVALRDVTGDEPLRIALAPTFQPLAAVLVRGERTRYLRPARGLLSAAGAALLGTVHHAPRHAARESDATLPGIAARAGCIGRSGRWAQRCGEQRADAGHETARHWCGWTARRWASGDVDVDSFSPSSPRRDRAVSQRHEHAGAVSGVARPLRMWNDSPLVSRRDTEPRAVAEGVRPEQLEELISTLSIYTMAQVGHAGSARHGIDAGGDVSALDACQRNERRGDRRVRRGYKRGGRAGETWASCRRRIRCLRMRCATRSGSRGSVRRSTRAVRCANWSGSPSSSVPRARTEAAPDRLGPTESCMVAASCGRLDLSSALPTSSVVHAAAEAGTRANVTARSASRSLAAQVTDWTPVIAKGSRGGLRRPPFPRHYEEPVGEIHPSSARAGPHRTPRRAREGDCAAARPVPAAPSAETWHARPWHQHPH